jgi:hypothetical protein
MKSKNQMHPLTVVLAILCLLWLDLGRVGIVVARLAFAFASGEVDVAVMRFF